MSVSKEMKNLFDDFQPVSTKEWKEKMSQDLKGLSFEKLIWKTNEGIEIKPFYTSDDLKTLSYLDNKPGDYPFLRGNRKFSNNWGIRQDIEVGDVKTANTKALVALNHGADSIAFIFPEDKKLSRSEFSTLLKGIFLDCIQINFITPGNSTDFFGFLVSELISKNIDPLTISGSIDNDPLGYLTRTGRFVHSEKEDFSNTAKLISKAKAQLPKLRTIGINGNIFHNAGATIVQELAFSLAMISEYLDIFSNEGVKPEIIAGSMQLNLSIGPFYFMEIAKIRAARLLFASLCKSWGVNDKDALKTFVHCKTSEWNQTIYDPYVNMLRSTTEGMSAVMAGCDSLTITPFDKAFRTSTEFSERISRNTQIILKEEAWLDKVGDPASGSYFIENLTGSIIAESWKLFLEIEELGGYLKAFKAGEIQKRISASANLRNQNIAERKEILLGTNQYPNPLEFKPEDLNAEIAIPKKVARSAQIAKPLSLYRGATNFEHLRLNTEATKQKVFLLTIGNPVWRKTRAGFASNFFGCAGFGIIDNPGFSTLEDGLAAAKSINASIIVLCSSDEEYAVLAPEAIKKIHEDAILVVAGYPKDIIEELRSKGVQHFIHIKSNILAELQKFQELLRT